MPVNMKIDGLSSTHVHLRSTIGNVSATSVDIYWKHLASERGGKHAHVWRTFLCEVFFCWQRANKCESMKLANFWHELKSSLSVIGGK